MGEPDIVVLDHFPIRRRAALLGGVLQLLLHERRELGPVGGADAKGDDGGGERVVAAGRGAADAHLGIRGLAGEQGGFGPFAGLHAGVVSRFIARFVALFGIALSGQSMLGGGGSLGQGLCGLLGGGGIGGHRLLLGGGGLLCRLRADLLGLALALVGIGLGLIGLTLIPLSLVRVGLCLIGIAAQRLISLCQGLLCVRLGLGSLVVVVLRLGIGRLLGLLSQRLGNFLLGIGQALRLLGGLAGGGLVLLLVGGQAAEQAQG